MGCNLLVPFQRVSEFKLQIIYVANLIIYSVEEGSNFHIGYFRDDPKEVPVFIAAYGGKKDSSDYSNYKFTLYGDNLFAAIYLYIGQLINKVDPFKMTSLQKLKVPFIYYVSTCIAQNLI